MPVFATRSPNTGVGEAKKVLHPSSFQQVANDTALQQIYRINTTHNPRSEVVTVEN
jgi:hypothetical protein